MTVLQDVCHEKIRNAFKSQKCRLTGVVAELDKTISSSARVRPVKRRSNQMVEYDVRVTDGSPDEQIGMPANFRTPHTA